MVGPILASIDMKKLAVIAALALAATFALPSKPAAARGCLRHCSPLFDAMAWTMAAGIVGGYAAGTGYFVYHDATDERQTLEYGGAELAANGALGALFAGGAIAAARDGSAGGAAGLGAFAALHLSLAAHGGWRVYERREDIHISPVAVQRFAGLAYSTNTLMWALLAPASHGRGYGVAEAAVNAPLAAGLGYLAYDARQHHRTGQTVLFGGMAAISGALAVHGVYTAVAPRRQRLELFGADLAPTVVSDGRETAPGLGASGTW